MAKKKQFDDPLEGIDPIMEQAFSEFSDTEDADSEQEDNISSVRFPQMSKRVAGKKVDVSVFENIPINLSVELGRSQVSLKEVFELSEGSIIELERLVGEPLDLVVNGQVVAQGEVVAIDHNYGLRVTSIISRL